jgi:hypothetical protein
MFTFKETVGAESEFEPGGFSVGASDIRELLDTFCGKRCSQTASE